MKKEGTVGIYGGTFSPPHQGHIHAVNAFLDECPLDKLYIVPTFIPPHKQVTDNVTAQNRLDMVNIAFSSHPEWGGRLFVSDVEIRKGGKSYTVDTVKYFSRRAEKLCLLIGTDMMMTFGSWYKPETICKYAELVFISRENETPDSAKEIERQIVKTENQFNTRITRLKASAVPMDSTSLREALLRGEKPEGLPDGVYEYIEANGLYK
ncbi:MAG: nicotinate (nicotinamide) nucleotide adenylyltransferase [Clostridia bacterium]|nr:nicotinate (nicotinamide) nucleotide adenylyltransferase [Clostridia bacterium]